MFAVNASVLTLTMQNTNAADDKRIRWRSQNAPIQAHHKHHHQQQQTLISALICDLTRLKNKKIVDLCVIDDVHPLFLVSTDDTLHEDLVIGCQADNEWTPASLDALFDRVQQAMVDRNSIKMVSELIMGIMGKDASVAYYKVHRGIHIE